MSGLPQVRWTVMPETPPEPVLACAGCGTSRPFRTSGKFRVNAQGKRLDAWRVYRCGVCARTWNRPLGERARLRDVEAGLLQALTMNDAEVARRFAFDSAGLSAHAHEIRPARGIALGRERLRAIAMPCHGLELHLHVPLPVALRLDRLLAQGLALPRAQVLRLARDERLTVRASGRKALKRPVRDGSTVALAFLDDAEAERIGAAAVSPDATPTRVT